MTQTASLHAPDMSARLRGVSPVAARLIDSDPRLLRFVHRAPDPRGLRRAVVDAARLRRALRLLRKRLIVWSAHQELIFGAHPLVTAKQWSDAADAALVAADVVAFRAAVARYGAVPGTSFAGRAVLALGKLGSGELNPSSDIDVVCVYGDDDGVTAAGHSAHELFTHWARGLRSLLADVDDDGFAFRVDFDLRPEGTRGPLVNSLAAMEDYYERFGRTWERAALLRLRASVDVDGVGARLQRRLVPFVFQRSLSPKIVDEIYAMKAQVTSSTARDGTFDVKRGRGGIREVEFIAQSLQLLHGGRMPALRQALDTASLLRALTDVGLLPHATAQRLIRAYEVLRRVEHALQLGEDRQTQELPDRGEERARVLDALAPGLAVPGQRVDVADVLDAVRADVAAAFERHLGEGRGGATVDVNVALDATADPAARTAALRAAGFVDVDAAFDVIAGLERKRGSLLAPSTLREPQARRFAEVLLEHVGKSVDPGAALARVADVFAVRPHGALLARLLDDDARGVGVLARVLALSAPLSRALVRLQRNGGVDDALYFALRSRRPALPAVLALFERTNGAAVDVNGGVDEEAAVSGLARTQGELVFGAALPFLAGRIGVVDAQQRLSVVADAVVQRALAVARARMQRRHGALRGFRFAVLALGSWGGRELGFFRDLDLAFVYDVDDVDGGDVDGDGRESDGARPIAAPEYATRSAQQVLWALTTPFDGAALYPVDTRLRPSGNQGALTTSIARFRAYHDSESALWERQALLRLRPVAGDRALGRAVVDVVARAVARPPPVGLGLRLLDMRAKMVEQRASSTGVDVKLGEGGIADIEFAVQGSLLAAQARAQATTMPPTSTRRALARLARGGAVPAAEAARLRRALDALHTVRESVALVDDARDPGLTATDARLVKLERSGALSFIVDAGARRPGASDGAWRTIVSTMAEVRETASRWLMRLP